LRRATIIHQPIALEASAFYVRIERNAGALLPPCTHTGRPATAPDAAKIGIGYGWPVIQPELTNRMLSRHGCSMASLALLTIKAVFQGISGLPTIGPAQSVGANLGARCLLFYAGGEVNALTFAEGSFRLCVVEVCDRDFSIVKAVPSHRDSERTASGERCRGWAGRISALRRFSSSGVRVQPTCPHLRMIKKVAWEEMSLRSHPRCSLPIRLPVPVQRVALARR
jgi:hypothetical protein